MSNRKLMDSSQPGSFLLRSTSAVSLNERFSQVLMDKQTQSRSVTFDPALLQQRTPPMVLLLETGTPLLADLQTCASAVRVKQVLTRRRRSIWTRLGWRQVTRRPPPSTPRGFWSFRNKYRRRAGSTCTYRRRLQLRSRLGRRHLVRRGAQQLTTGSTQLSLHLQRGVATVSMGRGLRKNDVPTKKQLDAQLDKYMSLSKSRLDKELDEYMSMSRSRLDAQLDEYMSMAGRTDLDWD